MPLSSTELVFLLGRYPPIGGQISIMFYNITKHLMNGLINLFILVIGFAFGFFIMHRNTKTDGFETPAKAIVKVPFYYHSLFQTIYNILTLLIAPLLTVYVLFLIIADFDDGSWRI